MTRTRATACGIALAFDLAFVYALAALPSPPPSPNPIPGSQAAPPHGFVRFCSDEPAECAPDHSIGGIFEATRARRAELDAVNRSVNDAVEPVSDREIYGVNEWWAIPTMEGDCEDYALLKRHILIKMGWPVGSVLLTVVRDEKGDGHTVLTVRTAEGEFILDNKTDEIGGPGETTYQFVSRQSESDPRAWVWLWAPDPIAGIEP